LLHIAAKDGHLDSIKFLVSIGLDINARDRWGATPLNYARAFPEIFNFMRTLKNPEPFEGPSQGDYLILASVYSSHVLSDDGFRTLYAAYNNDIQSLQILKA
jgi:hypothetical protein